MTDSNGLGLQCNASSILMQEIQGIPCKSLNVEFSLKPESGYSKDAGVTTPLGIVFFLSFFHFF